MPASATTVIWVNRWAALKALMTGSIVAVSALLPSNSVTVSGNPLASVSSPIVIWGSRRRSLENPGSRKPVTGVCFEVQGARVEQPAPGLLGRRTRRPAIADRTDGHRSTGDVDGGIRRRFDTDLSQASGWFDDPS